MATATGHPNPDFMCQPLLVLIPACNEAAVIGLTLDTLMPFIFPSDQVVVIDDGSTDATAAIAEGAGACAFRRPPTESTGSKGDALRWGVAQLCLAGPEIVIVLDADTQVDPGFLSSVRTRFEGGTQVMQGFIVPMVATASPVAALAACSTLMEQQVDDRLRSRLGWPVRLRGTGMAFRAYLLAELAPQLRTATEDVELSLLLAERGITVAFAPEAVVYDPLPASIGAAAHQRARWLAGQASVCQYYWPLLLRLLVRGPAIWSLLGSLLAKPRTLVFAVRLIVVLVSLLWSPLWPLSVAAGLILLADALYLTIAIVWFGVFRQGRVSLSSLPAYGALWVRSLVVAMCGPHRWLRARS